MKKEKKPPESPCVKCENGGTGKCIGASCKPFRDWMRGRRGPFDIPRGGARGGGK